MDRTPEQQQTSEGTFEEAFARLRASLDEMKKLSDAMASLIVKQMDPTAIGESGAEAAQQPN